MILKKGSIIACPHCKTLLLEALEDIKEDTDLRVEQFKSLGYKYTENSDFTCYMCSKPFMDKGCFYIKKSESTFDWFPEKIEEKYISFEDTLNSFESMRESKTAKELQAIWDGFKDTMDINDVRNEITEIRGSKRGFTVTEAGLNRLAARKNTIDKIKNFRKENISYGQYSVHSIITLYDEFKFVQEMASECDYITVKTFPFEEIFQLHGIVKELEKIEKEKGLFIFKDLLDKDISTKYDKVILMVQCSSYEDFYKEITDKILLVLDNFYNCIISRKDDSYADNSSICVINAIHSLMTRIYLLMFVFEYSSHYTLTQKENEYYEFIEKNF